MCVLRQGQIVWTSVTDPNGYDAGEHPVVITSSNEDIRSGREVYGIVASHTSALLDPLPDGYIPLPHSVDPKTSCCTKFRKETVAVCSWIVQVPNREFSKQDSGGYIKASLLAVLIAKAREIKQKARDVESELKRPR